VATDRAPIPAAITVLAVAGLGPGRSQGIGRKRQLSRLAGA
jgi:hypothetical protein